MYQENFGLKKPLFGATMARDVEIYLGPNQQRLQANLRIALSTRDSVMLLCGPTGVGKTTLAAHALRSFTPRHALGWLGTPSLTPHELLEQLLTVFEFEAYRSSRVERLQTWRQFLTEMSITDTRVCVLVENADQTPGDVLQALASLTASDPNGCPGANVILTSDTPITNRLNTPELELLKQRVRLTSSVPPLDTASVANYLRRCARLADGEYERIFAPDAAEMLHHYSKGAIRVLNNLCETALTVAATRRESQLSANLVMRVAVGLLGMLPREDATVEASGAAETSASASAQAEPSRAEDAPQALNTTTRETAPATHTSHVASDPGPTAETAREFETAAAQSQTNAAMTDRQAVASVPSSGVGRYRSASPSAESNTVGAARDSGLSPEFSPQPEHIPASGKYADALAAAQPVMDSAPRTEGAAPTTLATGSTEPLDAAADLDKPAPIAGDPSPLECASPSPLPSVADASPVDRAPRTSDDALQAELESAALESGLSFESPPLVVELAMMGEAEADEQTASRSALARERAAASADDDGLPVMTEEIAADEESHTSMIIPGLSEMTEDMGTEDESSSSMIIPGLSLNAALEPDVIPELSAFDIVTAPDDVAKGPAEGGVPVLTDSIEMADDVALTLETSVADPAETEMGLEPEPDFEDFVSEQATDDILQQNTESEASRHKRETLEALAHARALEDISNSMAETLFGDSELEALSATLAVAARETGDADEEQDDPLPRGSRAL